MAIRKVGILLAGVIAFIGICVYGLNAQEDRETLEKKLEGLLQQRRDTLQHRVENLERLRRIDLIDVGDVLQARIAVLDADLDRESDRAQRIELLTTRLEAYRRLEEIAEVSRRAPPTPPQAGLRPQTDNGIDRFLLARAARMQAEIDLLREQIKN